MLVWSSTWRTCDATISGVGTPRGARRARRISFQSTLTTWRWSGPVVITRLLAPVVGSYCPGLARVPYHVHRYGARLE